MHTFIHACAGSGKTHLIVQHCANKPYSDRRYIVLAFTENCQAELRLRLASCCIPSQEPHVMGWYAFLIQHIIKPYLPVLFPNQKVRGFDFNAKVSRFNKQVDPRRFFTKEGLINRCHVEELALRITNTMEGKVQQRLAKIYSQLIIDEVQDISEYGLDIIKVFLQQEYLKVMMVGDTRQTILNSNSSLNKNKSMVGVNRINWYIDFQKMNPHLLSIEEMDCTYRFNSEIAAFSNAIMDPELGYSPTHSRMTQRTGHDGVFLVREEDINLYDRQHHPTYIRYGTNSAKQLTHLEFTTFGKAKGLEWDRVAIYMTNSMIKLLANGASYLGGQSACKFYVGITRARYSVALILPKGKRLTPHKRFGIQSWPTAPVVLKQLTINYTNPSENPKLFAP